MMSLRFWTLTILLFSLNAKADIYLYGGIDLGVAGLSTRVPKEVDKFGLDAGIKGLVSFEFADWVFDIGIGYRFDSVKGGPTSSRVTVETKNGSLEISPRITFGEGWQFGPFLNFQFATEVGIGETLATSQRTAFYLGPQINYEWGSEVWRYRFGARGGMDLNIADRTHWMGQVLFQIGGRLFGGASEAPPPAPTPEPVTYIRPAPVQVEEIREPEVAVNTIAPDEYGPRTKVYDDGAFRVETASKNTLIITTYSTALNFVTGKTWLTRKSQLKFGRLAQYLVKNSWNWEKARISGHADERGSLKYNQTLSERRAAWIRKLMVRNGIADNRMDSRGYGKLRPVDGRHIASAWEKNRRVELVLFGVQDRTPLIDLIRSIPR